VSHPVKHVVGDGKTVVDEDEDEDDEDEDESLPVGNVLVGNGSLMVGQVYVGYGSLMVYVGSLIGYVGSVSVGDVLLLVIVVDLGVLVVVLLRVFDDSAAAS
jgi:hypothetical protein